MSVELYAALAAMAAEEHQLVMDGRYEDLAELAGRRQPLLDQLPDEPPQEALAHLQDALRFQELVTVALMAARERTARELQQTKQAHDGARGYVAVATAPAAPPASQVDSLG
ncbi:MAG: hypothetical protein V9E83_08680 [Baekduia sp.]